MSDEEFEAARDKAAMLGAKTQHGQYNCYNLTDFCAGANWARQYTRQELESIIKEGQQLLEADNKRIRELENQNKRFRAANTELSKVNHLTFGDLMIENQKLREALSFYADGYIFDEPDDDTELSDINKPWRNISGKRAREALAKFRGGK